MTKKRLQKVMAEVYAKYGQEKTAEIADDLKDLGFHYATMSGLSMGMGDFEPIEGMDELLDEGEDRAAAISDQYEQGFITDDERHRLTVENWTKIETQVQDMLAEQMVGQDSSMAIAINSGARGNISQLKNAVGMLGVLQDAAGNVIELPIKSGYIQGLNPLEYFTGTRGTRKALIDIALKTADAGYLTRRLVDVSQDVLLLKTTTSDPGFAMLRADAEDIGVTYASRLIGRFAAETVKGYVKKGELITEEIAEKIEADDSHRWRQDHERPQLHQRPWCIRRNLTVLTRLLANWWPTTTRSASLPPRVLVSLVPSCRWTPSTVPVRVVADDTAQGLTRIEELFEVRTPKGQAYLTEISGMANAWEEGDHYVVQVTADDKEKVTLSSVSAKPQLPVAPKSLSVTSSPLWKTLPNH